MVSNLFSEYKKFRTYIEVARLQSSQMDRADLAVCARFMLSVVSTVTARQC